MRVKLKIIFIILILLQYSITLAQHQSWVRRYTGVVLNGFDKANSIAIDNDGNVYVTGSSVNPDNSGSIATVKYNASGTQNWAARYFGGIINPNLIIDEGSSIAIHNTTQGVFVYVTGTTFTDVNKTDFVTIQYYPDGVQRWVQTYHGNYNGTNDYNRGNHIEVDNNGNAYVTGYITDVGTDCDYATIKYDFEGVQKWVASYDGNGHNDIAMSLKYDMIESGFGNVCITGYSVDNGGIYDDIVT